MPEVKVKHLYRALLDIENWTKSVRTTLGSLDPETVLTGPDQNVSVPIVFPPVITKGICMPLDDSAASS